MKQSSCPFLEQGELVLFAYVCTPQEVIFIVVVIFANGRIHRRRHHPALEPCPCAPNQQFACLTKKAQLLHSFCS